MILIITPFFWPNVGGVETHLNDLCDFLVKKNIKVQVLTYQPITVKTKAKALEFSKNLEIRRLWWPGHDLFHRLEKLPPAFNFLYLTPGILISSILFVKSNRQKIQAVHAQGLVAGLVGLVLKKIFNLRLVISTHAVYGFSNTLFSKISAKILNGADKILALSKPSKEELIRIGINPVKVGTYVHWVNQKIFKPENKKLSKTKLRLKDDFVVLFVGRLIKIKGTSLLINIAKKEPQMTFIFVGAGPEAQSLKTQAEMYKNIKFIGKVENRNLPVYYNAADVFVIPSQYEEGFGRVILESLSCGTPVIGSNRGGIKEAISSEIGILADPTEKSFRAALRKLFDDRQKLRSLTGNCRSYAVQRFSEKNAKIITDSYSK